jgi:DNA-binding response OmpR family regulator
MDSKNILVVDDDAANRDIVRLILETNGHKVDVAVDGKNAMEKVVDLRPDLVVLDVTMPDVDGFEVCTFIKGHAALQTVKVVLLTSQDPGRNEKKSKEAGADAFLQKPCSMDVLLSTIKDLLGGPPAS